MALRKTQKDMAISLFVKAYITTEDKNSRKELYIQFADAYEGSIKDWRSRVEAELADEKLKEEFVQLNNREPKMDIKEYITVEPLTFDDVEQISYLAYRELDTLAWMPRREEPDSINEFINGGYSYVAKRENVILGFILASKCPTYGGYYYLYIDTFVVSRDAQGNGIGKLLLNKLKEDMFHHRIYRVKLMTKREIPAYKIYQHLGFNAIEDYVHMQSYV